MKTHSRKRYTLVAVIVSIAMIFSVMPSVGYAASSDKIVKKGEVISLENEFAPTVNLESNDSRLEEFIMMKAASVSYSGARKKKLNDGEKKVYDYILEEIKEIASGKKADTAIKIPSKLILGEDTVLTAKKLNITGFFKKDENGKIVLDNNDEPILEETAQEAIKSALNVDLGRIIDALLFDVPYELYWYDKSKETGGVFLTDIPAYNVFMQSSNDGTSYINDRIEVNELMVIFKVADRYQADYYSSDPNDGRFFIDTQLTGTIEDSIGYSKTIIKNAESKTSDIEKLKYYIEEICNEVSYDKDALDGKKKYGDPWQIIHVFDKNKDTNVVCEGYSKAFKYLCDLTEFNNKDIHCHLVTGEMLGGIGAGNHMWNIVRTGDNSNYLVDVTNCDVGTIGNPDKLFMVYDANNYSQKDSNGMYLGYDIPVKETYVQYRYDSDTKSIFDDDEINLSKNPYGESSTDDRKKAADVTDIIKRLPAKANVILSNEAAITAARKAYDNLTKEQKRYVLSETYTILTDAESAIKALKAKQEADKLAAEKVIILINSLPDVNSININDLDKYNNIFSNIVAAYNKLSGDQQKLVESSMNKFKSIQDAIEKVVKEHNNKQNQTIILVEPTAATKTNSIKKIGASGISTVGNIKKKTMSLGWKKVKNAINYCVAYRKAGEKNWTYAWTNGKRKYVIKKLKANQMFEYKVAAYGIEKNKLVYGGWSNVSYKYMAATTVKLKAGKRSFKATIKRVKKSSGYDVIYALNKAQTKSKKVKALKGAGETKFVAKKLKKGKRYYVKVRPYKKYKGRKYVGILSKAYKVKVK